MAPPLVHLTIAQTSQHTIPDLKGCAPVGSTSHSHPTPSLRILALKGSVWALAGYAATQVLRLGSNLILTRLLFPETFGLMMLVNILMQGMQMFSDVGIGPSIISHRDGEDRAYLNTAWTIQIIRGLLLWMGAALLAWPLALFYGKPELAFVILISSIGAIIGGFNSTALFTLSRRLAIGRLTILELVSQVSGVVTMVVWAIVSPSIWALVGGGLASALVKAALSHQLEARRAAFAWNPDARQQLLSFGRAIALSTAMTFLASQSERLILGKFVTLDVLGVYAVGFMLARFGTQILQQVMAKVVFPSLSQVLREDALRALSHYRRIRTHVDALAIGSALVMILVGPLVIRHLYDTRYWGAGWMLQILAVQAAFDLMRSPASWLLLAAGKPRYNVWAGLARLLTLCIGLPLAFAIADLRTAVCVIAASSMPSLIIFSYGIGQTFPSLRASEWRSSALVTATVLVEYCLLH